MFYKSPRTKKFLVVDNTTYATLVSLDETNIDDKKYNFKFRCSTLLYDLIKSNILKIRIRLFSKIVTKQDVTSLNVDSNMIQQIINESIVTKQIAALQQKYIIASKNIDLTTFVDNNDLNLIRKGVDINHINSFKKKRIVYKTISSADKDNVILNKISWQNINNIKTYVNDSNLNNVDVKKLMINMISNEIDPSDIANMKHISVTPRQQVGGLIRKNRQNTHQLSTTKLDDQTQFLYSFLLKDNLLVNDNIDYVQNDALVATYDSVVDQWTQVTTNIEIHTNKINIQNDGSNLIVKFEVLNSNNIIIDDETLQLNINEHIKFFKVPLKAPIARVIKSYNLSRNILEISNFDPKTKSVLIYHKEVQQDKTGGTYLFFGNFLVSGKSIRVPINSFTHKYSIYRVIPQSEDNKSLGSDFTNVVVKPTRILFPKKITLISKLIENGIQLEVRNLPADIVSVQLLVKNKTNFEQKYQHVDILSITDNIRQQDLIMFIDTNVQTNCIYEYKVKCFLKNGLSYESYFIIVEFKKKQIAIDTKITNLNVDTTIFNRVNVKFQFESDVLDNDFDILHALLKNRDIDNLFQNDVVKERELFKKLLAHNIQRINLTTGERENFGTLIGNTFNDSVERTKNNVKQLSEEHSYRYEVYPMLRSAETLFETINKVSIDSFTKKQYSYQPAKFLHPVALNQGLLLTTQGKNILYTQDDMSYGSTGNVESIDVVFNTYIPTLSSFIATRINFELVNLTWKSEVTSFKLIDFYIIMKDVLGVRTIIGKIHSHSTKNNFLHKLTHDDVGQFKYIIVPVYNNYTVGKSLVSNTIEVLDVVD